MGKNYLRMPVKALPLTAVISTAFPVFASTFTVGGSGNAFTINRTGDTSAAETVHYRAVGLSAYAGQNFTSKYGSLAFAPGQTSTNVAVSTRTPSSNAYKFQSGTTRAYRFELLDKGGFRLDGKDCTIAAGTSVPTNGTFNIKNVTIQSAEYTADDDGALQNTDKDNGLNIYTGFDNSDWDPDDHYTAAIISQNAAWFDEHDARNGVSMKLIEDFPNFYKEPVVVAQDGVVTLTAIWHPPVPYIDADGTERTCTDYTVLTNAADDVRYGGGSGWYVVTNAVSISGWFCFDYAAHLIICDGATLAVTNANGRAIEAGDLTIYGQTNGTGAVTANGSTGIYAANGDVTINGGTVTANGGEYGDGIYAYGFITLGWTNPTDSITASSYNRNARIDKALTDGSNIYEGNLDPSDLAGAMLRPYIGTPTYPAYLGLPADQADDTNEDAAIRENYVAWAQRYGYDALGANETAYLLDVAPWAVTSDVAPLKEGFYDALTVCNGYHLVLRIGTDLSVPKGEWLEMSWGAMLEDGRAELLCPAFVLEMYRERVARETGKPCPGLFLSVTISPRPSSSTEFAEILGEELNGHLQ